MLPVVCALSLMNESRPTRMVPAPHAGFLQAPQTPITSITAGTYANVIIGRLSIHGACLSCHVTAGTTGRRVHAVQPHQRGVCTPMLHSW